MGAIRTAAVGFLILIAAAVSAADCVSEVRLVSTRSSVPNLVAGPSSWSGNSLAVAKTEEGVPGAVWVGVYDESLQTLVEDRPVAGNARLIVALLWNGSEHGLFYTTTSDTMVLQRLSAAGEPIGDPIPVTSGRTVYTSDQLDAVWSSALNAYVTGHSVSQGSRGLWLTVVERNGAVRSDRLVPVSASPKSALKLAVTDSGIIGAFFNNSIGSLVFARAAAQGGITVRTMTPGAEFIAVTAQDGMFVVTHSAPFESNRTEVRWFVVDTSQQIVRADATLVTPSGEDAWPLALISNGEELALSYIDAPRGEQGIEKTYRLRRFEMDGTQISDTRFSAEFVAFSRAQSPYPFAWSGTSYLSAAVQAASDRLNSYLLRFCPLRAEIVSPSRTIRVGDLVTFSATASGGVPDYQFSWIFPAEIGPKKGQTLVRTFPRTGTYDVTLEVTDFTGAITRQTITVNVIRPKTRAVRH
jgi:hypothetical protein